MNDDNIELMRIKVKTDKNIDYFIKDELLKKFKEEFGNIRVNGLFFAFDNENSSKNSISLIQGNVIDFKDKKIEIEAGSEEGTSESDKVLKKFIQLILEM